MPDSRQYAAQSIDRPPTAELGFSEAMLRAAESGRVTVCAQLIPAEGGMRVVGVRLALGMCERCPTIDRTGGPATVTDVDLVCQAVSP